MFIMNRVFVNPKITFSPVFFLGKEILHFESHPQIIFFKQKAYKLSNVHDSIRNRVTRENYYYIHN